MDHTAAPPHPSLPPPITPPPGPPGGWPAPGPPPPPPTAAPPPPPAGDPADGDAGGDRSRAGATWVTATGAFLLLAAATVFVAVRWEHLGEEVKLAILGALTGGFLLAGRRLRRVLPATGGVLFHLGALLIPLNVAPVAMRADLSWGQLLLLEGTVAVVSWFLLDRLEPSPVLRWGAGTAFVAAAAGAASVTGLPTPLVLAVAALGAQRVRAPKPALGWAVVAGLGPVLVLAGTPISGSEVAAALGLAPVGPGIGWAVSGALAAFVIGWEAHRRREPLLLVPAAASAAIGIGATWAVLDPSGAVDLVGAAALFLLIEVIAGLVRRDPFWDGPARVAAAVVEVLGMAVLPGLVAATAWWFATGEVLAPRHTGVALAALVAAAAWLAGDVRRIAGDPMRRGALASIAVGSGWWPPTVAITANVLVGVGLLSGSSLAVGVAMVALAATLVVTGRPGGHGTAVVLASLAPVLAGFDLFTTAGYRHPELVAGSGTGGILLVASAIMAIGLAGALVLGGAAVVRARLADAVDNEPFAWILAAVALVPIGTATVVLAGHVSALPLLLGAAASAWAVALVLDRADGAPRGIAHLGLTARFGALLTLLGAGLLGPRSTAVLAGLLTLAAIVDALRRRSELPLLGLAVSLPALVGAGCADLGLTVAETGLVLTLLAAVAAGAHLLLGDRRGWPLLGVVVAGGAAGFGLAATEPTTGWLAVLVLAGVGLAYATVHASAVGAGASAAAGIAAIWGLLGDARVEAFDAYLAPVALVLVIAGTLARRTNRVSSWLAYGPAIALLGGSALYERIEGGGGSHALVVGAVAVAAVIAGGTLRLAAPLLLGTVLLVGLTLHESLAVTRQVPTWGWLALGGTLLVVVGITMERRDATPMETGRRLVDVVGTRFH